MENTITNPINPSGISTPGSTRKMHPQKFMMWFAIGSLSLTFAGFTSAYLVRQGQGMWEKFQIPTIFYISTVVILLSSFTYFFGAKAFKSGNMKNYNLFMWITFFLGASFMGLQFLGFQELYQQNIRLNGNVSNSFFFVIAGMHLLHIFAALIALLFVTIRNNNIKSDNRKYLGIEILGYFWHFIDILWLYLFVFLMLYR
ncbi:MAG TPA: heme-copper oxidase subunit III [Edaphocola sp.]|nr:heme-copper oxidase subunit III [Edaphocola sp.]